VYSQPRWLTDMADLREDILALRCESPAESGGKASHSDERTFIPHQSLFHLLTEERILAAVNSIDEEYLEWHQKQNTVGWIMQRGRLLFGILVVVRHAELISIFTKHTLSDEKLPLAESVLNHLAPSIAKVFFDKQWEFTAPQLARDVLHRVLDPKSRMPFVHNELIAQGNFGNIYKIAVHPHHQAVPLLPEGPVIYSPTFPRLFT